MHSMRIPNPAATAPQRLQRYYQTPTRIETRVPSDSTTSVDDSELKFQLEESEREKARIEDELSALKQTYQQLATDCEWFRNSNSDLEIINEGLNEQVISLKQQMSNLTKTDKEPDADRKLWFLRNGIAFLQERARDPSITLDALVGSIASFDNTCENSINTFDVKELRDELERTKKMVIPYETFKNVADQIIAAAKDDDEKISIDKYNRVKEKYKEVAEEIKVLKRRLNTALLKNTKLKDEASATQEQLDELHANRNSTTLDVMTESELLSLRRTKHYHEEQIASLQKQVDYLSKLKGYYKENESVHSQSGTSTPRICEEFKSGQSTPRYTSSNHK